MVICRGSIPGLGFCSEVDKLALLHGGLEALSLGCQCCLLLKGSVALGVPLCLRSRPKLISFGTAGAAHIIDIPPMSTFQSTGT